ncbi:MAG: DUF3843 family protein [Bacteroidales bacterium]|nr:DUF3843 family protein [Bacteroidales bacterium]
MITLRDIRKGHPFGISSPTDTDYVRIANTMVEMLRYVPFCAERTDEEMKRMVIKLTLYFEDIVSEIGLWRSFVHLHRSLYGRTLPFYYTGMGYNEDGPNLYDIQFLLWDATLDDEYAETLVNPENETLAHAARTVYAYFLERFEDTPINDDLYDFFHEARFTDNFYDVRQVLKWYFFDCYLTSGRFRESTFDEALDYQMDLCRSNRQVARSAAEASIAFRYQVGPLALKPQEWLSALLIVHGHTDKAAAVAAIVAKDLEPYVLERYDRQSVTLRSVDDELMTVRRTPYFQVQTTLLKSPDTEGCVGSYARYNDEWYLNGMNTWGDILRVIPEYKKERDIERNATFGDLATDARSVLHSRQIFFFATPEAYEAFYRDELKMPKDRKVSLPRGVKNIMLFIPHLAEGKLCTIMDCAEYICHPDNPMYDKEKAKTHFLLADLDRVPGEFIRYAIAHRLMPDFALNSNRGYARGRQLAQDNLDFLARTLRRQEY